MNKLRMYNEAKATRSNEHLQTLRRKLEKSLGNRSKKERFWETEINAIDSAYVLIPCKQCNKTMTEKFKDWYEGKFSRVCKECKDKQIKTELQDMLTKLKPLLLDDYGACIDVSGYNRDSIVIKKKR